jgi:hypothetical protein
VTCFGLSGFVEGPGKILRRHMVGNTDRWSNRRPPRAAPAVRATFDGLERAIVARGRTVTIPHPTETIVTHRLESGEILRGPRPVDHLEGSEIDLPADEVERLRGLGFLMPPGQHLIRTAEGTRVVED